jgi:tetratricopeptide (TPR) repeat protein
MNNPQETNGAEAGLVKAMQLIAAGSYDEAEKISVTLVENQPNNAGALHALGLTHYMCRRYERAIEFMDKAIQFDGSNPQYFCNLGEAYRRASKPDQALGMFEKAVAIKPEYLLAHLGIANVFRDQKRRPEAISRYRLALALNPKFAEAYHYLGVILLEQGRQAEAIAYLRKATSLKPDYNEAQLALAHALDSDGLVDEAIETYLSILEKSPRVGAAHNNVANLLKTQGNIDEAIVHYEQALELNPANVQAHYNLSRARKTSETKGGIKKMEKMLEKRDLPEPDRTNLHFTLGKIYDDLERYDEAFENFKKGNELDNRVPPFDTAMHEQMVSRLINIFSPNFFARREGFGSDSRRPIFIVGMPRSGTTLTEQVIASHSKVFGAGELEQIGQAVNAISAEISGSAGYPDCANDLDAMTACRLGETYVTYINRLSDNSPFVTDKMPGNFMHVGFIASLLPNARIIHCKRQPMDSCLSCYFQHFTSPMPFSVSLEALGKYYQGYERITNHWKKVLPDKILEVNYEDMVGDHEATTRRILAFCDLEWEDACIQFHETKRPVKTASTWQVRQPLYSTSVERWRHFESHLQPLKDALGESFQE